MHNSTSWNHLLPESNNNNVLSINLPIMNSESNSIHNNKLKEKQKETESKDEFFYHFTSKKNSNIELTNLEIEAIQRYRIIQNYPKNISLQCEYVSSHTTHGVILQLILYSKLLPIKDWNECAQIVANWFQTPISAPLGLLSYAIIQIITTHQLTTFYAANWILNLSKYLLCINDTSNSDNVIISITHWKIAEEFIRSIYTLQTISSTLLFESFSAIVLDIIINEVCTSLESKQQWGLLTLCLLLRRHKEFALSVWEKDEYQHCNRMQRVCELGKEILPTHIAVILSSVV